MLPAEPDSAVGETMQELPGVSALCTPAIEATYCAPGSSVGDDEGRISLECGVGSPSSTMSGSDNPAPRCEGEIDGATADSKFATQSEARNLDIDLSQDANEVALDVSSVSVDGSSPLPKNGDQPTMIPDEMDTPAVEAMDISSEVGTEAVAAEEGYPTDEQLLKAIREAIAGAAHISSLTVKKVRSTVEKILSCSLENRKKFIKEAIFAEVRRPCMLEAIEREKGGDPMESIIRVPSEAGAPGNQSQSAASITPACDDLDDAGLADTESSASDSERRSTARPNVSSVPTAKVSENPGNQASTAAKDKRGRSRANVKRKGKGFKGSVSRKTHLDSLSRSDSKSTSKLDARDSFNTDSDSDSNFHQSSISKEADVDGAAGKGDLAKASVDDSAPVRGIEDNELAWDTELSASESGEPSSAPAPPSAMLQPQPRGPPTRTAHTKAKAKRVVRAARASNQSRIIGPKEVCLNGEKPDSQFDSDSNANPDSFSHGIPAEGSTPSVDRHDGKAMSDNASDAPTDRQVSGLDSGLSSSDASPSENSRKRSRNIARHSNRASLAKRKSTTSPIKDADDGDSALLDSDEDPTKAEGVDGTAKAVVQEELDDANEEKVRERRRVQAERQRQLDALRVMNAAQLKEATRTAQGTLLAKIKERQARVHAAIASSAKEELQRLKAEARKAAGMSVEEGDEEEGDQEEGKAECCDKNEDRAQENLQVEGIIAKEEEAIAAAEKAGNTMRESPLSGEESGAEGDADQVHLANDNGDLGLIKQNGEVSGRDFTSSQGVQEDAAKAHRSKSSSESPSSSQSDSDDSDSELEILPAAASNVLAVKSLAVARDKFSAVPSTRNEAKPRDAVSSSSQDSVSRALSALPKGMRFTSPKPADKSRVANRRKLAASARTVANDRWAAQLGYRNGQEHIRDLRYLELKRRQQAHLERERKERENAVLLARVREYEEHAEDDEREFGEAEAKADPSMTDSSDAVEFSQSGFHTEAITQDQAATGGSDGCDDGGNVSKDNINMATKSDSNSSLQASEGSGSTHTHGSSPEGTSEEELHTRPDVCQSQNGEDGSGELEATKGIPAGSEERGSLEKIAGVVGTVAASVSEPKQTSSLPEATVSHTPTPESTPSQGRPIVRTYGRKGRDNGHQVSKTDESTLSTASLASVSLDSQALWHEEPDSTPAHGMGVGIAFEHNTCDPPLDLRLVVDEATQSASCGDDSREDLGDSRDTTSALGGREASKPEELGHGASKEDKYIEESPTDEGASLTCQGDESGAKRKRDVAGPVACDGESRAHGDVEGTAGSAPMFTKMKIAADGSLGSTGPAQRNLATYFGKGSDKNTSPASSLLTAIPALPTAKRTGIAAFFGKDQPGTTDTAAGGVVSDRVGSTQGDRENPVGREEGGACSILSGSAMQHIAPVSVIDDGADRDAENVTEGGGGDGESKKTIHPADESRNVRDKDEPDEEEEIPKDPKDRSANYRAMLEAERVAAKRAKKFRKSGIMDDEAEEEEEEEAVRGLGDFGFGVPASGNGTSASGTSGIKGDEEEEVDEEIREEDLEGIVDTFSDDEGDKDAQETFLNNEAADGDRQALKEMVRRVREGFGDERGGRGRGATARGNLRLDELTRADKSSRKEARRLGLLNSDEEWSDDERGKGEEDGLEELDEQALGELLAREQRARHMGLSQTAKEYLESDSEEEAGGDADGAEEGERVADAVTVQEELDRREEERVQKLWVRRAKRRRVLAEVEQSAASAGGDSQGPDMLMEDKDSQAILNLLQCTNSRHSLGYGASRDGSVEGLGESTKSKTGNSSRGVKRGARDEYSGELDAQEVANGFGMGMSRKPLKRSKSEGTEPLEGKTTGTRSRLDRSFTLPQFVTSVAGFGGSARAQQKKGSFLSRAGSIQARSGSLASGNTTVSASKFVFTSSVTSEDSSTRTGFEDSASRDQTDSIKKGAGAGSKGEGEMNTGYNPLWSSGTNLGPKKSGAFSGIGTKAGKMGDGGTGEKGRLFRGLRSSTLSTSKR